MRLAWLTLLIPFIFYILVPLVSGGVSLFRWFLFRRRFLGLIHNRNQVFLGRRDGDSQGRGIWFRSGDKTVFVKSNRYLRLFQFSASHSGLQSLKRGDLAEFPEGSDFLVAGKVSLDKGYPVFSGLRGQPVYLIATDAGERDTLIGSLVHAHPSSVFWTAVTPWSLVVGFLVCLALLNQVLTTENLRFLSKLVITETLLPVLIFIPPGGFLSYLALFLHGYGIRYQIRQDQDRVAELLSENRPLSAAPPFLTFSIPALLLGVGRVSLYAAGLILNIALFIFILNHYALL